MLSRTESSEVSISILSYPPILLPHPIHTPCSSVFKMFSALFVLSVLAGASAQQIGTNTAETHPPVTVSKCTASGCTTSAQSIVLDANWRWVHTTTGYTNCYTGNTWNTTICPDGATCAANCALVSKSLPRSSRSLPTNYIHRMEPTMPTPMELPLQEML